MLVKNNGFKTTCIWLLVFNLKDYSSVIEGQFSVSIDLLNIIRSCISSTNCNITLNYILLFKVNGDDGLHLLAHASM